MMIRNDRALWIAAVVSLAGCGGSDQADADAQDDAPTTVAEAMQAASGAMQNMPGMAGNTNAPSFTPEQLRDRMPETAAGLPRTELSLTNTGMPGMTMTNVQATYQTAGAGSINVMITDLGAMPGMAMGMAAWSMTTFDRSTTNGFERTTTYEGYKAFESQEVRGATTDSALNVMAGNYLVQLIGNNVPLDTLKDVAGDLGVRELGG
jgi:hypothetical protein